MNLHGCMAMHGCINMSQSLHCHCSGLSYSPTMTNLQFQLPLSLPLPLSPFHCPLSRTPRQWQSYPATVQSSQVRLVKLWPQTTSIQLPVIVIKWPAGDQDGGKYGGNTNTKYKYKSKIPNPNSTTSIQLPVIVIKWPAGDEDGGFLVGCPTGWSLYCEFCFRILALSSRSVRCPLSSSVTWAFMPIYIDFEHWCQ